MTHKIDAVIVSHFHLDHCGALPHFTEQRGYNGPILMTLPTKSICPILLEDYRKITAERKGEKNFFTSAMIKTCMSKVITVKLHETVMLYDDMEVAIYIYIYIYTQSLLISIHSTHSSLSLSLSLSYNPYNPKPH